MIIINTFEIHYPIQMKKILLLLTSSVTILMNSTYGNGGKVAALGDNSPTDDGTGASLWLADL